MLRRNPIKTMNLRTVTIWTTGLTLIGTFIVPCVYLFGNDGESNLIDIICSPGIWLIWGTMWFVTGSPLLVSQIIAVRLKYEIPAFILLLSTIIYGCWFGYVHHQQFSAPGRWFVLPFIFVGSLYFMLPAWFIAIMLNRRYAKREKQL